jgi:uncharacterized protein (DUF2236 family)
MSGTQPPQLVSPGDLEALLTELQDLPGEPRAGFFGPDSITWRVNRESAIFLGAGRAALLQLAHPWVAASLLHHSNLMNDAIGRFHGTFRVIYTMLFGSRAQALAASRQIYRLHTGIRGELPHAVGAFAQGEHYEANELQALRWVFATLVDSAMLAYEFVLPPLTAAERERYYAESKRVAALFGIPSHALPADWGAFTAYVADVFSSSLLGVDANARAMGQSVLSGAGTWVRPPHWYGALTASWLSPRLRQEFALPFGDQEELALRWAERRLPRFYARVPAALRTVGPFYEAQARLRGQVPGLLTRSNNRFWMGVPRLLYPQLANITS